MSKLKIYKASAGSGKTYTLALEYIKELILANIPDNYRHILAVTFTKDATGEMKDRILAELYGLAFNTQDSQGFLSSLQTLLHEAGKKSDPKEIREKSKRILHHILHDYSHLNITTIDSFFQRVLRNLARELGKGSRFNLEMNTDKILFDAVHATIEKAGENKQILNWLTTYIENKLDESKNWRIEEEIFDFSRCIYNEYFQEHEYLLRKQLHENPGIFAELNKQQQIIQNECKTFFKKTFARINTILDENQFETSDFGNSKYAVALFAKTAQGDYKPAIGPTIEKCRANAETWGSAKSKRKPEIVALAASHLIPLLQQTLETLSIMNTSLMISRNLHQLGLIRDITEEISEQNAINNRFMLSDTALFLHRMIDRSDAPFIYEKLGAEIRHMMIDEFQDTSRLQWNNFKVFLADIQAGNHFSLIVGDVKQSIYRWRNGDWRILENIGKELDVKELNLNHNYRSEKEIIEFNNNLFPLAARSLHELYENHWSDTTTSPFLSAYNTEEVVQQTKKTTKQGFVSIDFISEKTDDKPYDDRVKETVLEKLQSLYKAGIPAREICILTRYNKDLIHLADYLSSQKTKHPPLAEAKYLDLVSNEAFRLDSSLTIKIIIEALRCIADPDNPIAQAQLKYLTDGNTVYPDNFTPHATKLRTMPLLELITYLYNSFELAHIAGQTAYLFTFYDAVSTYLNERYADIPLFLAYWNEELHKKTIASSTGVEGIRAMSIHKSKGLQFHTVIIPYCDWNIQPRNNTTVWCGPKEGFYDLELLPVSYNKGMAETIFAEEFKNETSQTWMDNLNLLYVAFTRAEHNLLVLARDNEKLDNTAKINTVSDLLQININQLSGNWNEKNSLFEKGNLDTGAVENKRNDNLLKQTPESFPISFVAKIFKANESIFKQSNQSREFLTTPPIPSQIPPPSPQEKRSYIDYGNLMHKLFEQINTWDDIGKAVANLVSEGLIHPAEAQDIGNKIRSDIVESNVEDWFSGKYKIHSEATILTEENGELKQKRPDRVLTGNDSVRVIDFKFGAAHNTHKKQVKQYMQLLEDMGYSRIEGYLWYVEERKVEKING
ncbi:MAG: UvrD-helicase domain-containing protein [Dysgonamonadaceae bacterium]|jgi:ATP-dependent exoDNAse (exonuclease V) beta subunit|nr:UvrD-helicase domain-containing protein [Dysgonamonadaceae bacterium]